MLTYSTSQVRSQDLGAQEGDWLYNGLDCCITLEVFHAIHPQLDEITRPVYEHALAMQAPILEMECRGIRVDDEARGQVASGFYAQLKQLEEALKELLIEGLGLPPEDVSWTVKVKGQLIEKFMWNSPLELKKLFYERMGFTPIRKRGVVSTDRNALEKLRNYFHAECIVNHILAIRDISKKLGVLRTGIDRDGRIRTSYNIAGTDTGRLSSYASSFGSGTNLQNITGELRRVFVADPGKRLCYIDLEQAEARGVGAILWNLFHDGRYLDFCESGDLHTNVCKMTWPDLGWTGDMKKDKEIAKQKFYRDFDYRDASKRLGHATNYVGQPPQISRLVRIPMPLVQAFQHAYFAAFPIRDWHAWVRQKLIKDGWITTFMGRRRWFFGRRWEDETHRAAVAYEPQSAIADYLNRGLLAVWRASIRGELPVELLLQVHDAIVFQYDAELENEVVPQVRKLLEIEVPLLYGRSLTIPTEAMVGWNWAYAYDAKKKVLNNPDGLVPYTGSDDRRRSAPVPILDRKFY
jgi:DNA polymerase-1